MDYKNIGRIFIANVPKLPTIFFQIFAVLPLLGKPTGEQHGIAPAEAKLLIDDIATTSQFEETTADLTTDLAQYQDWMSRVDHHNRMQQRNGATNVK